MGRFPQASEYIASLRGEGDALDKMVRRLVQSYGDANRVRKAMDERFNKGVRVVPAIDRNGRVTKIRRVGDLGKRRYQIEGTDGSWYEPEEKVWALAMFELGRQK